MTRRLINIPVQFGFDDRDRDYGGWSLSDRTKLVRWTGLYNFHNEFFISKVELLPGWSGEYPTDTNLTIKTYVYEATAVREWGDVEFLYEEPVTEAEDPSLYQEVKVRLWDGTESHYWTGATWAVAGSTNWNTPAEIVAHLSSFDVTGRKIGFEFRLLTTDVASTPILYGVRMFIKCEVWSIDTEVIDQTIIPALKANVSVITKVKFTTTAETASLDYSKGIGLEYPFDITGVYVIYDLTNDPDMETPLTGTWNPTTKVFTFTTPVEEDTDLLIYLQFTPPTIAATGDRDYILVDLPAILLMERTDRVIDVPEFVVRNLSVDPPTAKVINSIQRVTSKYVLKIMAEHPADAEAISAQIDSWMSKRGIILTCESTGRLIPLTIGPAAPVTKPNEGNVAATISRNLRVDFERFNQLTAEDAILQKEWGFSLILHGSV